MFEDDLRDLAPDRRDVLQAVIRHVAELVPEATAGRSYGLPAFRYRGKPLLGFSSSAKHLSLYPFSPAAVDAVRPRLADFDLAKGTIRFTPDRPVPADVLTELVQARAREIEEA